MKVTVTVTEYCENMYLETSLNILRNNESNCLRPVAKVLLHGCEWTVTESSAARAGRGQRAVAG